MVDPLEPLLADGVIDEVVARLKSGKEADLWLVRHGAEIVAAKVYKSRQTRSFKNNSAYLEGRKVRNSRTQRAMDRGSRFGQAAAEEAWKTKEADALHALHAAGVSVPRPVLFYEGVLLMEVVVDAAGRPAPRLVDARLEREQAAEMYAGLRSQVVKMLCCDLVHGDLSPYNVLLGREGPVIIDFPQVVGAAHNSQAEGFFFRDLANLRHFFEALDPALRAAAGDGREIWRAYSRRELTPDFVPAPPRPGAPPAPEPRSEPRPGPPRGRPDRGAPPRPQQPPQQQPPRPPREQPHPHPQQQRPSQRQPQHPQERQAQRPPHQAHPRPGAGRPPQGRPGRPTRQGPVVQRVPVLGGGSQPRPAPAAARPVVAPAEGPTRSPAPTGPGRGHRRRRRGRRGGGAGGPP